MTIQLLSNVLCVKREKGWILDERSIARRLSYFHLLELSRVNPNKYPFHLHRDEELSPLQRLQRDRFLKARTLHLWDVRPGLHPIPGQTVPNPFAKGVSPPTPSRRRTEPSQNTPSPAAIPPVPAHVVRPVTDLGSREQDQMVKADPDADLFVVAPPGTGKTHVLVERIAHLVTQGLCDSPAEEILVLSFTRSAVAEVRRRIRQKVDQGAHPDTAYARVLTFDSLATRAISLDKEAGFLSGRDFTARIELFNKLIGSQLPNALENISKVRYLFVDEVQDLSGCRASMVLSIAKIVKSAGGAVCFLGDPAQAIYDFDEDPADGMSSEEFLVKASQGAYGVRPPRRIAFDQYRRFETPAMLEFVRSARHAMGEDGLHPDGHQLAGLIDALGERFPAESLGMFVQGTGTKAILTKTNLEAYQLWALCEKQELNAELWRGASGQYWPGWISRVVLGFKQEVMPLESARSRWREHIGHQVRLTFDEAIHMLELEGSIEDGRIDLVQLNRIVSARAPSVLRKPGGALTISTIHRSKGLEFDEVLVYLPKVNFAGDAKEVRVVYVAATRAKRALRILGRHPAVKFGLKNNFQNQRK